MNQGASRLAVLIDGAPLPDDDARALWTAFSEHMDQHRGDLAGFAASRGWFSVKPEHRQGKAVLVVQTSEAARPAPPPKAAPPKAPPPRPGPRPPAKPQRKPQEKGRAPQGKAPKRGPEPKR